LLYNVIEEQVSHIVCDRSRVLNDGTYTGKYDSDLLEYHIELKAHAPKIELCDSGPHHDPTATSR
ncbi:MAG: hypothetical protein AAF151_21540, partial [Cyanobacteria bacterium J06656_5]